MSALGPDPADLNALSRVGLFRYLDEQQMRRVLATCRKTSYGRGSLVVTEGDAGQSLFVIVSGKVRVFTCSADGREKVLAVLGPGDYFGELSMLDGLERSASADCVEDSILLELRREEVQRILAERPEVAMAMLKALSARLRSADRQIGLLTFGTVTSRVAAVLAGTQEDVIAMPHREIAAAAGTTRETVTRVLTDLERRGLLRSHGRRIHIVDRRGLQALSFF